MLDSEERCDRNHDCKIDLRSLWREDIRTHAAYLRGWLLKKMFKKTFYRVYLYLKCLCGFCSFAPQFIRVLLCKCVFLLNSARITDFLRCQHIFWNTNQATQKINKSPLLNLNEVKMIQISVLYIPEIQIKIQTLSR